ncbi:MAG: RNA polymerase factor sigma-54 [Fibromonadaceae bacterium]|jgi:RNA polymerase sigma-54 factor|nr:RNA polymerase factor sigma-54 [Fibromonadaceae bacterium]
MAIQMNISQGMRIEQKLSAQTILTAQILQMNSMELEVAIQQEMEINPLLEIDDDHENEADDDYEDDYQHEYQYEAADKGFLDNPEKKTDLDWDDYFKDGAKYTEPEDFSRRDPDEDEWERPQSYDLDVQEYLLEQLKDRTLPARVKKCVEYLIGCVGDNGFLQDENEPKEIQMPATDKSNDIIAVDVVLQNEKLLPAAPKFVKEAFEVLRSFEPTGVGAFNLRDCFLIQARKIENFSKNSIDILENHYDSLLELRYMQISKALNISLAEVNAAIKELARLNPHPLSQIQVSKCSFITPDFVIEKEPDGSFNVVLRDGTKSKLRINESYKNLAKTSAVSGEERSWIRGKLNSANIFMRSIESRRETMLLVMNAIVRRQYDFFARGPQHLKPMILQDIAKEVNRVESTVNRVTNGKYVQTAYGIFELKKFFSAGVAQEDGTEVSNVKIKDSIRDLINNENKRNPLSDQEIAEILEKRGLKVARRTVNKYREAMGILPVKVRRSV